MVYKTHDRPQSKSILSNPIGGHCSAVFILKKEIIMNYKIFNGLAPQFDERDKLLIMYLNMKPMTSKELVKSTGFLLHQVRSSIKRLKKKNIVSKRYFEGVWYYGLTKTYRSKQREIRE